MAGDNENVGSFQVTLTTATTRQKLVAGLTGGRLNASLTAVVVKSIRANTGLIYLGDSTVTASIGFEVGPGEAVPMDAIGMNEMYAVSDTDAQVLNVLWIGPA